MLQQLRLNMTIDVSEIDWYRLALIVILVVAGLTHAVNMLDYPFYNNAEGTNAASAWALLTMGDLSPYTYTYQNPPMGGVILAFWTLLTSFIPSPDTILSSGRVLMLVTHLLTTLALYGVCRKLKISKPFALIAVLIFSLSPLVIVLQRRVLLENLMTLGVLVSFYLALGEERTLLHYAGSALAIGMAFLVDVVAILFVPALVYVLLNWSEQWHRRFAVALWTGVALSLFLEFPLHAQLKDELFPTGVLLGGDHPHVSLLQTQSELFEPVELDEFLRSDSSFVVNFKSWLDAPDDSSDPGLIILGFLSVFFILIRAFREEPLRPFAYMLGAYLVYMFVVDNLYSTDVIPMLPLFAISIGIGLERLVKYVDSQRPNSFLRNTVLGVLAVVLTLVFGMTYATRPGIYSDNQVDMQIEAANWLSHNVPFESVVVTDNYAFVDIRRVIPGTHYYWMVDSDPEVRSMVLEDNWCNIDYMLITPQIVEDMQRNQLRLIETAYLNSEVLKRYENSGWPIEIRQVIQRNCNIPFD